MARINKEIFTPLQKIYGSGFRAELEIWQTN